MENVIRFCTEIPMHVALFLCAKPFLTLGIFFFFLRKLEQTSSCMKQTESFNATTLDFKDAFCILCIYKMDDWDSLNVDYSLILLNLSKKIQDSSAETK